MLDGIERALIIRQPHLDKILSGEKTLEMRSNKTKIRGKIALIEQGTGTIVGTCELDGVMSACLRLLKIGFAKNYHLLDYTTGKYDKWLHGWRLTNVKKLDSPIPYKHPKGAVIWVKKEAWTASLEAL